MADDFIRNWSYLPSDLLIRILGCMNARVYHLLLRAVCPAWRSALPLSGDGCPLLHHQPRLQSNLLPNIEENVILLISSPNNQLHRWVIQVTESKANKWTLFNPLTKERFFFPSAAKPDQINLLNYRITELGRSHVLQSAENLSSKPVCILPASNYSCVLMGLSPDGSLLFLQSGFKEWVNIGPNDVFGDEPEAKFHGLLPLDPIINAFEDIISYKGRFYAVDVKGRLVMFDPSSWQEPVLVVTCPLSNDRAMGIDIHLYLVESEGSLYLVMRGKVRPGEPKFKYSDVAAKIQVFVLMEEMGREARWAEVRSIGDRVFFVGGNATFSVLSSTSVLNEMDCIYFGGGWESEALFCFVAGMYYLNADEFVPFNGWGDRDAHTRLFWPPPSWICGDWDPNMFLNYTVFDMWE